MPMLERTCILTEYAHHFFPEAKIIWGGVHTSIFPSEVINELPVDYAVINEGDETIVELLETLQKNGVDIHQVKGIAYKAHGRIFFTPPRELVNDLNILPLPAWDLIDIGDYYYLFLLESRGCPFHCAFCYNKMKKQYRMKTIDGAIDEIKYLYQYKKVRTFKLWDDLPFGGSAHKMIEFCEKIVKNKLDIRWTCFTRNELVTEDVLKAQIAAGCFRLVIGMESGSQRILDKMRKHTTVEKYIHSFELIHKHKISTAVAFILGYPGENQDDLAATLDLAHRIKATEYYAQFFKPYPSTDIYREIEDLFDKPPNIYAWARFSGFQTTGANFSSINQNELNRALKTIQSLTHIWENRWFLAGAAFHQFKTTPFRTFRISLKLAVNHLLYRKKQVHPREFVEMMSFLGKTSGKEGNTP
jgi:Fe-S oxidoreductase